jgi:hypothetical protein
MLLSLENASTKTLRVEELAIHASPLILLAIVASTRKYCRGRGWVLPV